MRIFEAQIASRHADLAARWLQTKGRGFYTISSAGHESNAAVAYALRPTDPALLHYRSGAFYVARAAQVGRDGVPDILRGVVASALEPMTGGRHKVFGHGDLNVIPQTSTIASHLPRALGIAFAIERARKLGLKSAWPVDALTVCSFGDASVNHSTAVGALNAAMHSTYQGLPLPVLFLCEDNGIGISVRTPRGWVAANYARRAGLKYFAVDGADLVATTRVADEASAWVRDRRRPAFLHLQTVRLMGHAGSDVELAYRSAAEMRADLERDPLLGTARILVDLGLRTGAELVEQYEQVRRAVACQASEALLTPQIQTVEQVMEPLRLTTDDRSDQSIALNASEAVAQAAVRSEFFADMLPESEGPLTLAQTVNRALADALAARPQTLVFGEDVAAKGGVYGVTRGLVQKAGAARVFDTLLDEQTVLGLALGVAVSGMLPVPEIQYLAYLHNAEDQLRGEAASLPFFSNRQYLNPMVVRIAGYAYQKGFGGHFHNDNSVAVLRDIPGLLIASPSHPSDAAAMLRTCLAAAQTLGKVCVYLEPIALYHTKDLHEPGDRQWLAPYAAPSAWKAEHVPVGRARTHGNGADLTIVTFGNGVFMSMRVARRLAADGIACRVVDMRWLAPLPIEDLLREAIATGAVLVVDETRRSGGVADTVAATLVERGFEGRLASVCAADSFIPLGDAAETVLVSESEIEQTARAIAH